MNYGMWVAASGVTANIARQNVLSNNLANVSTVGFKPDRLPIRQREAARIEDNLPQLNSNAMLERLGAGVMPMATEPSFSQGPIRMTDNALDVAIRGEGFLRVTADSETGFALTRDGRMTIGRNGLLSRTSDGAAVLGADGSPIALDPAAPARIDEAGTITQNGRTMGRLDVVTLDQPGLLRKSGEGNFLLPRGGGAGLLRPAGDASVVAGAVEDSGVNAISTLMGVTSASKAASGGLRMVSQMHEITGLAVTRLGKVS